MFFCLIMSSRNRNKVKTALFAAAAIATTAVALYTWLHTSPTVSNELESGNIDESANAHLLMKWPRLAIIAIVVNKRVLNDPEQIALVKTTLRNYKNAFIIIHPSINDLSLDLDIDVHYKTLTVSKESSIFHILKEIKPSVIYLPKEHLQEAMEIYRLPQFIPNVTQLGI